MNAEYRKSSNLSLDDYDDGIKRWSMSDVKQPGKLGNDSIGSYALNLTWRSEDWKTYEGTLDATVESYLFDDLATIRNASFNFCL